MKWLLYIVLFFASSSEFPRDPYKTLKSFVNDTICVGIAQSG